MCTRNRLLVAALLCALPSLAGAERYGFGRAVSEKETAGWDIDVTPDGSGLPPGRGTVAEGAKIYGERCASCHGDKGQGKPMDRLVGGNGTLATDQPVKTVGSYWPYATTLYDYIHRAMPFNEPQSLTPNQVYAVVAYVLRLNGIVDDNAVMDAKTLPKVRMPNADGFVGPDPRPDAHNIACKQNCR
ncbi:MAG: c-type cytochrome [Sulfurifustaceae bacterium]